MGGQIRVLGPGGRGRALEKVAKIREGTLGAGNIKKLSTCGLKEGKREGRTKMLQ